MNELLGKKIVGLLVNDDQSVLVFNTEHGPVGYRAEGDCCSETWFADITGVSALIGGTVAAVEQVSTNGYKVNDGRCRQEEDEAYGYKIVTDKGHVDIVFRNSSNGYYGGWIDHMREVPPLDGMTNIEDDWNA